MKLLLLEDVPSLGYFGDVVVVKNGYARNYLLPQQLATLPSESKIKEIEAERAKRAEERVLMREALVKVCEKVNEASVTIEANANPGGHLYGSVAEADIAKALQDAGFEVKAKQVAMSGHITQLGEYHVSLKLAHDLKAKITVNVVAPGAAAKNAESKEKPEAPVAEGNE
ncbi:MAG: 50S ribosomal protein L9 [Sedimentisphaerales bacterium]|nr:50S ribosomal protein L9 [Sedimentisphaerales bacterium]MBN2843082.1 50S ribosomal protein L9 [Sedimentisphaerales bacterium]